jgi:hypothetical protein
MAGISAKRQNNRRINAVSRNVTRPDTDSEYLFLGMYQPSRSDLGKLSIVANQHPYLSLEIKKDHALTMIPKEKTSVLSSKSKPIRISGLI